MRKPNLKNLKRNYKETKRIRTALGAQKSVKITINIDAKTLKELKSLAGDTGIPYQRLLNRTLRESLEGKNYAEKRLEEIEKEITNLKKRVAA